MKQKLSEKDELEIKKAPEELTEKDLEMVAGGVKTQKSCTKHEHVPRKCPGNSL